MYVLPLCFFSTRNSWGLFFFPFCVCLCCVTLVGRKGCKIHGDAPRLWDVPGWWPSLCYLSVLHFCFWGISRGLNVFNQHIVTAVVLLRMLPWGGRILLHRQRCEKTWSSVFTSSVEGSVWGLARSCSSQARQDRGRSAKGKVEQAKGHSEIPELSQPQDRPYTLYLCLDLPFQRKSPDNTAPSFWHLCCCTIWKGQDNKTSWYE